MVTVHMILNSHLDPIWLWPWQAGLDSALATCRSACDRLDAHSDVIYTRGEAWIYSMVERVDPKLFARIQKHVRDGRWEIVGGWWIQPDCNAPSGFAMEHQIELGRQYFQDRFGFFPRAAYNVDSFGHAATLPTMMRRAGQDRYVMMRPQSHEMELPARIFRWRENEQGPEVITYRIPIQYNCAAPTVENVGAATDELPEGIKHTMLFLGAGDHGGGPTERLIALCREKQDAFPGCKLQFSSVARFFDAIADSTAKLPVVTGELQFHAIGCYSVHRPVKTGLRKAEHLMRQAEIANGCDPRPETGTAQRLQEGWRQVCMHQFHDTVGGTCLPSAYPQVDAQLGMARAIADETIHMSLRRQADLLPDDSRQRIVLLNASDAAFDGYVETEPYLEWAPWQPRWRLLDEQGAVVPMQQIATEAATERLTRLLCRVSAAPGQVRVLRIDRDTPASASTNAQSHVTATTDSIATDVGVAVDLAGNGKMQFAGQAIALPRFDMIADLSDTWTHRLDRYAEGPAEKACWNTPMVADAGPLMASLIQHGRIGESALAAEYRVYAGMPFVELLLRIHWTQWRKMLKLTVVLPHAGVRRWDGIMGGETERALNGREHPLRDRTLVELANGGRFGIVCPDVFAMDGTASRLRLTLLRSPLMAHHEPHSGVAPRVQASDQGMHEFRFRFLCGTQIGGAELDQQAMGMQRPLVMADLTRGMPASL